MVVTTALVAYFAYGVNTRFQSKILASEINSGGYMPQCIIVVKIASNEY